MRNTYRAVVFDYDMTIADTGPIIASLLNRAAEKFGYLAKPYDQVASMIGHTQVDMLSFLTEETDMEKILTVRAYYRELCREEMTKRTTFFPGLEESLTAYRENGIKAGILSLKLKDLIVAALDKYNLTGYFDQIFGVREAPAPKPDPSGFFKIAGCMGVEKEEVLYVGDSLVDEETARNAGVDFCAMLLGATRREQFDGSFAKLFCSSHAQLCEFLTGR